MQVRHDEGVANHIGPEPCVVSREARGEASVRGSHRPAIEPRNRFVPGAEAVQLFRKQYDQVRYRERLIGPAGSENLACVDAPCAGTGRSHLWPKRLFGRSSGSASGR